MERITTNEWRGDRDSDSKYVIPKELPTAIVTVESRRRRWRLTSKSSLQTISEFVTKQGGKKKKKKDGWKEDTNHLRFIADGIIRKWRPRGTDRLQRLWGRRWTAAAGNCWREEWRCPSGRRSKRHLAAVEATVWGPSTGRTFPAELAIRSARPYQTSSIHLFMRERRK